MPTPKNPSKTTRVRPQRPKINLNPTETEKTKVKQTHVCLVLDSSGSMQNIAGQAVELFNQSVKDAQEYGDLAGETTITLVLFGARPNSQPVVVFNTEPSGEVSLLDEKTYSPYGNTPLRDAIMLAIKTMEPLDAAEADIAFRVTTITDGQENASGTDARTLSGAIQALEAKGNWTFDLVGANVSIRDLQISTGIKQAANFTATVRGAGQMVNSVSSSNARFYASRGAGGQSVGQLYDSNDDLSDASASASLGDIAAQDVAAVRSGDVEKMKAMLLRQKAAKKGDRPE